MKFLRRRGGSGDDSKRKRETTVRSAARAALEGLGPDAPHRVRIWLADSTKRVAAIDAIQLGDASNVIEVLEESDGRVRLDISSGQSPRTLALHRILGPLKEVGIDIGGYEAVDIVTDAESGDIEYAVNEWALVGRGNRRPLEALAGEVALEYLIGRYAAQAPLESDGDRSRHRARGYSFGALCVAINTPGCERRLLEAALAAPDAYEAHTLVNAAESRRALDTLIGRPNEPLDEALLLALATAPKQVMAYSRGTVVYLLAMLGPDYSAPVLEYLEATVHDRDAELARGALRALGSMPASERLRVSVDVGLASKKAALRSEARRILLEKWNEKPPKDVPSAPEPLSVPTFEPTETGYSVQFDDDAAWSKARMRFEKLVAGHPAFTIEEADREFVDVATTTTDAEAILEDLWTQAATAARKT